VCTEPCSLTDERTFEPQDSRDVDWRQRTERFIRLVATTWQMRQIATHHRVMPTCHAVGWIARPLVHVANSHWSGEVLELHLVPTKVLCVAAHVCACVTLQRVGSYHFPTLQPCKITYAKKNQKKKTP